MSAPVFHIALTHRPESPPALRWLWQIQDERGLTWDQGLAAAPDLARVQAALALPDCFLRVRLGCTDPLEDYPGDVLDLGAPALPPRQD